EELAEPDGIRVQSRGAEIELQVAGHVGEHEGEQDDAGRRHDDLLADRRVEEGPCRAHESYPVASRLDPPLLQSNYGQLSRASARLHGTLSRASDASSPPAGPRHRTALPSRTRVEGRPHGATALRDAPSARSSPTSRSLCAG